ncbi:carbonic anhydrase-related protein 10-like isoform X2 [Macrosteles quadrilineatus]|uniref:carbonic anhydrase-related protein 10-like isoform X1 n=1 Tax=Macrosteles quadrilineatus TaxID=74068 RepID=UPI0023E2D88A|nr:carbonic anhydrase-related protein 10-like isoform X1 [Macrosteles quadrilineatus]XP_054260891.1 carbonic anhydrase-related protein 10-like isoform X2 [Macrosteles quadrilineatus]XP_054264832.1 carbonic anhydrase-related protein 10-like isoform X1 [Macrosteles quadrilineatus]XP_054264833.1 carbonic anhydrase-related protein 10-like isoform X2 [Macrosteles quadrilineatus]
MISLLYIAVIVGSLFALQFYLVTASWEEWWTYDGISGPEYWGRINPEWSLCNKGRRQSPINVEPHKLLFDPHLRHLDIDKHKISGTLINTGQSLVFRVDRDSKQHVNISGGPLAYRYQFEEFFFHYGIQNQHGSEHRIHGYTFPGEIQLYGFNAELYHNMSEAQHKSQGIVGISLMVQIGDINQPNSDLRIITSTFNKVLYKGSSMPIRYLSLHSLLPDTTHYMTYEGSTTHPGCWETTVWIIINKPVYITKQEMYALRKLMQGSQDIPKAPLGNNARPLQPLHHRTVRTNIDFQNVDNALGKSCPVSMKKEMYYKANQWRNMPDAQFLQL